MMRHLRELTTARVGLGRAGNSLPTRELLDFQLAHARARDAVHCPFDPRSLALPYGREPIVLRSAAKDRREYLQRPDLGRQLSPESRHLLSAMLLPRTGPFDVVFVFADGLSSHAVHRHAPAVLREILGRLDAEDWRIAPVVTVENGRVAVADEIGELLQAALSVILIGERPGLSSPDSLGIYLTWGPRKGRMDAERNCISNIHGAGLGPGPAAALLDLLMSEARRRKISGVDLKVVSGGTPPNLLQR